MLNKSPTAIDRHVGGRVRMRRMLLGMSQTQLGDQLGVTFQQIQKYEKGTNRIGASRLHSIARVLGVPIEFFYEGVTEAPGKSFANGPSPNYVDEFVATPEGLELIKAFLGIKDPQVRRRVLDLARALGSESTSAAATKSRADKGRRGASARH